MGSSTWSQDAYTHLKRDYSTKSTGQIFTSRSIKKDLDPKHIDIRESRDSQPHPNSVAVAVFLDVTGSMGMIPEYLIKNKLGLLMETLIKHNVPDAHVLFGGIGDHYTDRSPLQIGQFEAGTKELDESLTKIHLEGGGGGQDMESYSLAWLFASRHTSIDCFEKRGQKGFLFTIGDEATHPKIEADRLKEILGYDFEANVSAEQSLTEAKRMYEVFHLHINETHTGRQPHIFQSWQKLLGERVIKVEDKENVAEIIASTVAVVMGADLQQVASGFDASTQKQVTSALAKINSGVSVKQKGGIITL